MAPAYNRPHLTQLPGEAAIVCGEAGGELRIPGAERQNVRWRALLYEGGSSSGLKDSIDMFMGLYTDKHPSTNVFSGFLDYPPAVVWIPVGFLIMLT